MAGQFGVVTMDGQDYIERIQVFPVTFSVTQQYQVSTGQRVTLPGVANFRLKGLTREVIQNGATVALRFAFRLGNSDGTTWYFSGGLGETTDRVIDTCCFGTGAFPFPLTPPLSYSAGSNIMFEIEDLGTYQEPTFVPYTINLAFHGSYLIPVTS